MKRQLWSIVSASTIAGALVLGSGGAALADEPPVVPAALAVGLEPGILTLPAGDQVRDTTVARFVADVPTTATVKVLSGDRATEYRDLGPVEFAAGDLVRDIVVPVEGLPTGNLLVEATPAGGEPTSVSLTVGSGLPQSASLGLSRSTIYTWTGSSARTSIATVSVKDETGLKVPFTGSLTVSNATASKSLTIAATTGDSAQATIGTKSLPAGSYTVSAAVTAQGENASTNAASIKVVTMTVNATSLKRSETSVYPSKDGYRDSVDFSLKTSTSTGGTVPVTGTVKIKNSKGKTVKYWNLSSSKAWTRTWDGRISGKIVPGTYRVEARVRGPEGTTRTDSTQITVREGHLVTKTYTQVKYPAKVFTDFSDYSASGLGECNEYRDGDVDCDSYSAYYNGEISLILHGRTYLPDSVVASQKYGKVKARLKLHTKGGSGSGAWGFGPRGNETAAVTGLAIGWTTPGWKTLPVGTTRVDVGVALGEYTYFWADSVKIEYKYQAMVS